MYCLLLFKYSKDADSPISLLFPLLVFRCFSLYLQVCIQVCSVLFLKEWDNGINIIAQLAFFSF